jgi:hypothetical protein
LSGQSDLLHAYHGRTLADLRRYSDLLGLHADLRHDRSDMYRLADLYWNGDVQQDAYM